MSYTKIDEPVMYTLPTYWASYLINGDHSGLAEGEKETIDKWVTDNDCPHLVSTHSGYWFSHTNDATNIGGDVCEYTCIGYFS